MVTRYSRTFFNDARGNAFYFNQSAGTIADKAGSIQNEPGGFIGDAINPGHNQRQLVANGEVLARYGDAPDSENPPRPGEIPKYVNRNCMIAQAAGSWIGGWQGASWCMAG